MRHPPIALALLTLAAAVPSVAAQQPVVIEGTTVVSPHLGAPITGASVFIRDGRIEAVAPADELDVAPEIQRIDGRGKWVIPGLVEYHTHNRGAAALSRALALGVTFGPNHLRLWEPDRGRRAIAPCRRSRRLESFCSRVA